MKLFRKHNFFFSFSFQDFNTCFQCVGGLVIYFAELKKPVASVVGVQHSPPSLPDKYHLLAAIWHWASFPATAQHLPDQTRLLLHGSAFQSFDIKLPFSPSCWSLLVGSSWSCVQLRMEPMGFQSRAKQIRALQGHNNTIVLRSARCSDIVNSLLICLLHAPLKREHNQPTACCCLGGLPWGGQIAALIIKLVWSEHKLKYPTI